MSKLAIAIALGITAASIVGGTYVLASRRKQQHSVLAEPVELDLALAS